MRKQIQESELVAKCITCPFHVVICNSTRTLNAGDVWEMHQRLMPKMQRMLEIIPGCPPTEIHARALRLLSGAACNLQVIITLKCTF